MHRPAAVETLEIAPHDFPPLALASDDRLAEGIELVLGYRHGLATDAVMEAMRCGLRGFPHLTGQADGEAGEPPRRIVPSEQGTVLEVVESSVEMTIGGLEALPLEEHASVFMPHGGDGGSPVPLFGARLTRMPGLCVLGLRVSHMAVDGTGLAWFISHCTAAMRGVALFPVFHDRRHGFGRHLDGPDDPPHRYRAGGPWVGDPLAGNHPLVFAIQADVARMCFNAPSLLHSRLHLAALLCAVTAGRHPEFTELGLWCDPRGTNGIPAGYTGNAGCFLHFPLRGMTAEDLTRQLREMTTRAGFQRIADSYRRIKRAEADGRPVMWDGPGNDVLQLNLVPHAVAGTDFGGGVPAIGLLLSRNSSGLRISLTPDGSRFLVEACLPAGVADSLVEACRAAGLRPSIWCRGRKLLECPRP